VSALLEVMTTKEATELWGKSHVTVKHLCTGIQGRPPRLQEGTESYKAIYGVTWVRIWYFAECIAHIEIARVYHDGALVKYMEDGDSQRIKSLCYGLIRIACVT